MGGAAEAVGDLVEGAGDAIQSIGDIAESAVREVGHAVESVGREVGKVGQTAINDPVGTIAKVAAVASGQWWALPLVSAGLVIANGGDIGKAALAAGISLAAQGVAYGVGEALGSAGSGISDMIGQDAASLAEQGLSNSQIADVLAQSYPELASEVISQTADLASMGFTGAQIASDLGSSYGAQFAAEAITPSMQNALANIAANTGGSGVRAALSGGDLNDVLTAMGTAGLGTAVGAGTSTGLQQTGLNSGISNTLGAATGATAAAAASGKDGTSAFINSLINTTLREAGQQSKAYLKQAWDKVKTSVDEYNTQLTKTNDTQTSLVPLEKAAKDAETAVNAELEAYKPVRQRFSDLVSQYDAAKAAGNVELANSLADQANAMIPELNAATEKYNSAYANYETKLNTYSTAVEGYKTEIAKTDELKAGYEKNSVALGDETKKLSEAASKVVTMAEPVQNAFAKMYQSGTDVDTALENSNKLNGMTTIAQEAFNRDIATSNSADTALEFANKINSLDTKQQSAFQTGITTGLDNAKAFEIAPVISSYNPNQQQAYAGAVKQGYGQEGADLISAFASFAPEKTTSAPATSITPTTRDVASEFVKLNPLAQDVYKELIDTGMKPTEALDAIKQATTESGSPDGGKTIYITGVGSSGDPELDAKLAEEAAAKITAGVYGGGTADPLSSIKSMFGSGATGNVELPALFAFGTKDQQDQAIQYLDDIIKDPTATPEQVAKANQTLQKVKGSKVAGGGGGGGGTSGTSTTTTAPTTAPTTTTGGGQAGSGETTPTNITPPDASFTGTGTTGTGTTTTAPKAGTPTTTAGTGTGTGGGAGTGTGTGTGSGTGTGTGTGTGSGSGSGSGAGTGAGIGLGIGAATLGSGYGGWQALQSQDQYGGIKNLTPGLTERVDYTLSGLPKDEDQDTVNPMSDAPKYAGGGSAVANTYDPYSTKDVSGSGISGSLTPGLSKAQINYILTGLPGHAEGGSIEEEHNPSFFSEGGLGSIDNRYVKGEGDGTSDSVAAMLANGEFVIPADVVSKLGNGSNEAGAGVLDQFLVEIRKHANSNGTKLPPESKGPLGYLLDAKRKVKA